MFRVMENKSSRLANRAWNGRPHTSCKVLLAQLTSLFFLVLILFAVSRPGYIRCSDSQPAPATGGNSSLRQSPPGEEACTEPAEDKPTQVLASPPARPASTAASAANSPDCCLTSFPPLHPGPELYDYHKPVPVAAAAVTDDFFNDAAFIGDSRTAGFKIFCGPLEATYYTANGLKVDTLFTREIIETDSGKKITILEALQQRPLPKIYIMLGINELGWAYSDLFIKKYGEVIDGIRHASPQAHLYVQSLLPVSQKRSLEDKIFNNERINQYNELIQQMAAEKELYYLDVAQCVSDAEGNLADEASSDGIHLQKTYCELWLDYLKWHYVLP